MAVAAVLFSTSCKKDDEANVSIVGKWTLSEVGTDANNDNKPDGETGPVSADLYSGSLDVKSDNTFTLSQTWRGGQTETVSGTYTYSNNTLTTIAGGKTDLVTVNTLTSNKLITRRTETEEFFVATWKVYTK